MDKRVAIILIFFLVLVGIILIGKQQEQDIQLQQVEQKAAGELKVLATEAQRAQQMALQEAQRAEEEAARAKQIALEKARQAEAEAQKARQLAEEAARKAAEEMKANIAQLLVQAQSLLDGGQFQQAIDVAKQILMSDPANIDAQTIIEKATAMLQDALKQQAETVVQEQAETVVVEGQQAVEGVTNLLAPAPQE